MNEVQTVSSREAFAGRRLRLVVDTMRDNAGRTYEREVVVHPGAVAILALVAPDELVMLEHYR